jgi:hypothetical protein
MIEAEFRYLLPAKRLKLIDKLFIVDFADGSSCEVEADDVKVDSYGALVLSQASAVPSAPLIPTLILAPRSWTLVRELNAKLAWTQPPPAGRDEGEKPFTIPFA